jgi:hypothetical protein
MALIREHDKQVKRQYDLRPRPKLEPFRTYRLRPKNTLGETVMSNDVESSLLMVLPSSASALEKQNAVDQLAAAILGMTGETHISAISVGPEIN